MVFELRDVTKASTGKIVYSNYYWICKDGDPKQALYYGDAPQCNLNEDLASKYADILDKKLNYSVSPVFLEIAYR